MVSWSVGQMVSWLVGQSVGPSVMPLLSWHIRAVFASLLLPNRMRLGLFCTILAENNASRYVRVHLLTRIVR